MYSHQLVISQIKAVQGGDGDGALGQVGDHVVTQVHLRQGGRGDLQPEIGGNHFEMNAIFQAHSAVSKQF